MFYWECGGGCEEGGGGYVPFWSQRGARNVGQQWNASLHSSAHLKVYATKQLLKSGLITGISPGKDLPGIMWGVRSP